MSGLIAHFVHHRTAANLAMVLSLCLGLGALYVLNVQLWPTYEVKNIHVQVSWRGASVGAMDRLIARSLDTTLNTIARVRSVRTTSYQANGR